MTKDEHLQVTDLDLFAYADDRLDEVPELKERIEALIEESPETVERIRAYRMQSEALRDHYGARAAEAVPDRLYAALDRPSRTGIAVAGRAAAIVSLVLGASLAGWVAGQYRSPDSAALERFVADSHRQFEETGKDTRRFSQSAGAAPAALGTDGRFVWRSDAVSLSIGGRTESSRCKKA